MNHCTPVQKSMWITVTSPNDWPLNHTSNIGFINSIINQATGYGVSVGIYTSVNDWKQITNGYSGMDSGIKLWAIESMRMINLLQQGGKTHLVSGQAGRARPTLTISGHLDPGVHLL
ncbi:hypothetical protein ANCDUO_21081 [Ancylostoma duodenale]|uniref:Uncharacterized protein n=1 Tax=Ancylostoma duodenale TaxID=51022 RepID=A0A0C2FVD5_9BILA|nr:hypothetical protein ANCDUO_21081 [Ancylostoma duodenale]